MGDEASDSLLSQTPRSDASSVITETFLDERKSRMIDNVVLYVTKRIKAMFIQARGGAHMTSTPSSQGKVSSTSRTASSVPGNNNKRKIDDRDPRETEDEDEDTSNPRLPKDSAESKEENAGYACPYFKYNPAMYKSARNCPGPGWPNVHRVK